MTRSRLLRALVPPIAGLALLVLSPMVVSAQADPYTPGTVGYDVSYPNCSGSPSGAFGVVGLNGGRPFTVNSCLSSEYSSAAGTGSASLYINSGFAGAYRKMITSSCQAQSASAGGTSAEDQAWAIGCSEAETSLSDAANAHAAGVKMWWLDVETANSWSSRNLALNRFTIQGATSRLLQTALPVGVYSTASMWRTITGGAFTPAGLAADWLAGSTCAGPAFTSSPVWLAQTGTRGGIDSDTAC